MKDSLRPGLKVDFTYTVSPDRTVPHLLPESQEFRAMPEVLATGYMVALFEWACIRAVNPHLDWPREQTVGIHVNLSHVAATPPGLNLRVRGELVEVRGRKLTFRLEADDGVEVISTGAHERAVIDRAAFDTRVARKGSSGGLGQGSPRPGR